MLGTLGRRSRAMASSMARSESLPLFAGIEKRHFQHLYAGRIIKNAIRAYEKSGQPARAETLRRKWLASKTTQPPPRYPKRQRGKSPGNPATFPFAFKTLSVQSNEGYFAEPARCFQVNDAVSR